MREIFLSLILVFSASANARTLIDFLSGGDGGKHADYMGGPFRFAAGYAVSETYDVSPASRIEKLDSFKGPWAELDMGFLLRLHFGFAQLKDDEVEYGFNGGALGAAEVGFDKYQFGLKINLPFPYVNVFAAGGFITGHMTVKSTGPIEQSEHSRLTGRYYQVGLDFLFSPYVGLRLAYTNDTIKTRKFLNLGNTAIDVEQHLGQAGLLVYF